MKKFRKVLERRYSEREKLWQGGFTLIELMIVLAVILALISLYLTRVGKGTDKKNAAAIMRTMEKAASAMEAYKADIGVYPDSLSELWDKNAVASAVQPFWKGQYMEMPAAITSDGKNIADKSIAGVTYLPVKVTSSGGGSGNCANAGQIAANNVNGVDYTIKITGVPSATAEVIVEQIGSKICRADNTSDTTDMYYAVDETF